MPNHEHVAAAQKNLDTSVENAVKLCGALQQSLVEIVARLTVLRSVTPNSAGGPGPGDTDQ
jgi:hypothetical protein